VKMMRRSPSRSRSTRFSALTYSITAACCRCNQPATTISRNCRRVVEAAISRQCSLLVRATSTGTTQPRGSRKPGGVLEHYGLRLLPRWDCLPRNAPAFAGRTISRSRISSRTRSIWRESWTRSRIITTRTAYTVPLTARRRRDAHAHHPRRPRVLFFANMLGRSIVAVCFTHRFQPEYEFATYRHHEPSL
jgi:hypothetical protein